MQMPERRVHPARRTEHNGDQLARRRRRRYRRQLILAVSTGVLVTTLFLLWRFPYLPRVLWYMFPDLDDYRIFPCDTLTPASPVYPLTIDPKGNLPAPPQRVVHDLHTTALLVVWRNRVIYERYWRKGGRTVLSNSFSVAKSVTALLAVRAMQEGVLDLFRDRVQDHIPALKGLPIGRIPLFTLLQMTSGTSWVENYWLPISHTAEGYYGNDLFRLMAGLRLVDTPGRYWRYKSGDTQLMGMVLEAATGRSLSELLNQWFWQPMGVPEWALWAKDAQGITRAFCCLFTTARAYALFGVLVLHRGVWNGDTLISPKWIRWLMHPVHVPDAHNPEDTVDWYGAGWWRAIPPSVPDTLWYARGIYGQYILVFPGWDLVIVRLGERRGPTRDHHPEEVYLLAEWAEQIHRQMMHR